MKTPTGLGNAGKALWRSISKGLPKGWEFDEAEITILTLAARQADDVARCERIIKRDGAEARGSAGQVVVHPAVIEARQGRLAIGRLLGQISLPDEAGETQASKRARLAARARWDKEAG